MEKNVHPIRRIGLAVSGGADSTALAVLMAELQREHGFSAVVLHVDHGLRAESADETDAFFYEAIQHLPAHGKNPASGKTPARGKNPVRPAGRCFFSARKDTSSSSQVPRHAGKTAPLRTSFNLSQNAGNVMKRL